jgi:hypothetical protein
MWSRNFSSGGQARTFGGPMWSRNFSSGGQARTLAAAVRPELQAFTVTRAHGDDYGLIAFDDTPP